MIGGVYGSRILNLLISSDVVFVADTDPRTSVRAPVLQQRELHLDGLL